MLSVERRIRVMMTPLAKTRRDRGLTQIALAAAVGTDSGNISRMERMLQRPSPEMAERLAKVLHISEMKLIYPERYTEKAA